MTMTNNYLCPWYAINMTSVPQVTTFYSWCVNWCAAYLQNMPGAQVLDRCAKKFPLNKPHSGQLLQPVRATDDPIQRNVIAGEDSLS